MQYKQNRFADYLRGYVAHVKNLEIQVWKNDAIISISTYPKLNATLRLTSYKLIASFSAMRHLASVSRGIVRLIVT